MNAFRKEYAAKSSILYGEIKTATMNANDEFFMESQSTYEWVSVLKPLLEAYLKISRAESTKKALIEKLAEGLTTLTANQATLDESLQTLDPLTYRKTALKSEFNIRFDKNRRFLVAKLQALLAKDKEQPLDPLEKDLLQRLMRKMQGIKQFGLDLTYRINEVAHDIESIETKLQDEIETIENVKEKIEPLKAILDSDTESDSKSNDYLTTSAQDLIAECKKYREKHINRKIKLGVLPA